MAVEGIGKQKTVEQYLKDTDYSDIATYLPSDFAFEFINFIKLVNGTKGEEHKSPIVHYKMLDKIGGRSKNIANMCHRGIAKTAVLGEYLFLYLACFGSIPGFGKIPLAIYVSDSIENGVKNMRKNLEFRWENSEFLQKYVPTTRFTDVRWEFHNASGDVFIIKGYGAKTGVRGAKELGTRPTLAVLDDLVSDDDAKSPTVIASIEATVYKAVEYALHPTKFKIIWSGTPFNARDPLYKAVESGAWDVNMYPVCEQFPCEREDFRSSWPDRFTYDYVLDKYTKALYAGKIDGFNQELMLRIMSDEDRLIQDSDIRWYSRKTLLTNKNKFNWYITTDFATSEKKSADNSVISVWAYNSAGEWFWVDGIVKKQDMHKNVNDLFRLVQEYRPISVGVEVSGQQGGFIPFIQAEGMRRNNFIHLATEGNNNNPGIRPASSTSKLVRFNVMVPMFKMHMIHFPEEVRYGPEVSQFIEELSLVSAKGFKSAHDDCSDTISMLALMNAWKPAEDAIAIVNPDSNIWEFEEEEDSDTMSSYVV